MAWHESRPLLCLGVACGQFAQPLQSLRRSGLDRRLRAAEHLGRFGLAVLLPVPQQDHRALAWWQLSQQPHQLVPQVHRGRAVRRRPRPAAEMLGPQDWDLALPRTAAPPAVGGQVVERPPQVRLRAGNAAPVAQQPLQRGLQQVLGVGAVTGEGDGGGHQPVAPLGTQPLKLHANRVTFPVTTHRAIPFRCWLTPRLQCRKSKTKQQGQRFPRNVRETSTTPGSSPVGITRLCPGRLSKGGASVSAAVEELVREGLDRLTAVTEVPPGLAEAAVRRARHERVSGHWLAAPPAVTLIVGLWGVTARPYWGDEVDTVSAVSRSLPQLARLLGHTDAVHGLYYLLLWPVAQVAGTGALVTRLPSVVAMAGAALGVSEIGRRLRSRRAGLCAGLAFAVLPIVTQQAHDARPYAMVTATAVLASYLLLRAAADPRPARFAGYGLSLVLLGYLEVFGLLMVLAHAITLIALGRRRNGPERGRPGSPGAPGGLSRSRLARQWLVTIAAVAVAVAPVLVWGWLQRGQIGWIKKPGWSDVDYVVRWLAAGSAASAVAIALLAVLGGRRADAPASAQLPGQVPRLYPPAPREPAPA